MIVGPLIVLSLLFGDANQAAPERIRLVVLTDISSLTPGVAEPDDGQSLIRLMLYANDFDIEGLVATSNLGHGLQTHPEFIHQVVDAYEKVQPNLIKHNHRYPAATLLRAGIRAGQNRAGLKLDVMESIGESNDTPASDWIIKCTDRPDPRPLWVIVWGGSADLAQALWKVRQSRTQGECNKFVNKLRIHTIGDQDSTGPWIRNQFPELFVIAQQRAYRGMYRGGDISLANSDWVENHIHGHGPLGDLYPNYRGGDIWSSRLGPVRGIKEGDTPSFLALLPNGLTDTERPDLGSWGGRFAGAHRHLTDIPDRDLSTQTDPDPRMSSVYRWRPAFQADFAARLDWCTKPLEAANHPPVVRIDGPSRRNAKPGETITLNATASADPDRNPLDFAWTIYPPDPELSNAVSMREGKTASTRLELKQNAAGKTIPILLSISDRGTPSLTRYGRVMIHVDNNR